MLWVSDGGTQRHLVLHKGCASCHSQDITPPGLSECVCVCVSAQRGQIKQITTKDAQLNLNF